jgi:hypothetical protein
VVEILVGPEIISVAEELSDDGNLVPKYVGVGT